MHFSLECVNPYRLWMKLSLSIFHPPFCLRSWRQQLPHQLQPERQQQQHHIQQPKTEEIPAASKQQHRGQLQHVWRRLAEELRLLQWKPTKKLQRIGLQHQQLIRPRRDHHRQGRAPVATFQLPAISKQQLQQPVAEHLINQPRLDVWSQGKDEIILENFEIELSLFICF